jgi:nicotinamidase-related amidase
MKKIAPSEEILISKDDSLLVIIDMQENLVSKVAGSDTVVENILRLIRFSRIVGIPMVVTEQEKLGKTISDIRDRLRGVQPISKLEFNCFRSNEFRERLTQLKRNTLIIAGIEAHICVAQTAMYGLSEYNVHVVSDAISSRSIHNRVVAINRMRQFGVHITSTEMFIFELLGKAGTNTFKEVLKLIK